MLGDGDAARRRSCNYGGPDRGMEKLPIVSLQNSTEFVLESGEGFHHLQATVAEGDWRFWTLEEVDRPQLCSPTTDSAGS